MKMGPSSVFYHSDLGPTNIIIGCYGEVQAAIDWESAAFYPTFHTACGHGTSS
ncbi:hypothetical protein BKA80DRAFT_275183 [Phyllosticta citrichinensis]